MSESPVGQQNPVLVFEVGLLTGCVRWDAVKPLTILRVKALVDEILGRFPVLRIEVEQPEHLRGPGKRPGRMVPHPAAHVA
jgi:hypothetical protein